MMNSDEKEKEGFSSSSVPTQPTAPPPPQYGDQGAYPTAPPLAAGYSAPGAPPPYPAHDPAYPPGYGPSVYQQAVHQPYPFSEDFRNQYAQDYTSGYDYGFIPPASSLADNEVIVEEGCMPSKDDTGCCFYMRMVITTLMHLTFFACLIGLIVSLTMSLGLEAIFGGCMGGAYFFLFIESLCAYDLRYLRDIRSAQDFAEYMTGMRASRPTLTFHCECYHYETRYRTVTERDSNGNTRTRTESYQEKVVTYRGHEDFYFVNFRDIAPPSINLENRKATRIFFKRTYRFGDQRSVQAFEQQSLSFRSRNRNRDVYFSYWEVFSIPGFTERMLAYVDPHSKHRFFNPCFYVLCSAVLCTWPYRWWFKKATARTDYTWIKELTI